MKCVFYRIIYSLQSVAALATGDGSFMADNYLVAPSRSSFVATLPGDFPPQDFQNYLTDSEACYLHGKVYERVVQL